MTYIQLLKAARPKARAPELRGTANERGYGANHVRWRRMVLNRCPVCRVPDCGQPAVIADHVVPLRWGGERYALANGQGLCVAHHNRKGAVEESLDSHPNRKAELVRRLPWLRGCDE